MEKGFNSFFSAGNISRVCADFVFPQMTLCTLITSWFCGNKSSKTVPFKLLRPIEIKKEKENYKLSKIKLLMSRVQLATEQVGEWWSFAQEAHGMWDQQ